MVDETENAYAEEDEYHFSDDQTNYDMDSGNAAVKMDPTVKAAGFALTGFTRYRRWVIIGILILIALIGVYRFLSPSYTPQPTDFTAAVTTPTSQVKAVQLTKPVAPVPQPSAPLTTAVSGAPIATAPTAVTTTQPTAAQSPTSPAPLGQSVNSGMPAAQQPAAPLTKPMSVNDRIAQLEKENARLNNVVQVEYPQKMADIATQESEVQAKLQDLNNRIATMETVITQLNQLLQSRVKTTMTKPVSKIIPKMIYSVQAIIPGRAWLKSESGDTVTVAEGDTLKGYGKISKIDPYDGVVMIDTGSKILTLSYGSTDS